MPLQRIRYYVPALLLLTGLLGTLPGSAMAATSPTTPHDLTHPYVMQQTAAQVASAPVGKLAPFTAPATMSPVGGAGGPMREVFGFALASSLADPTIGYPTWNFSLLTTVAFFGLHVNDDGTLAGDSGATVWNSSQLTGLLTTAHIHGTRVVLTIILQDFSPGTPHMCAGLTHMVTTINATIAQIRAKGVDGVNIDYEGLNGSCGTSDANWARHTFTNFVASFHNVLPAGDQLSVDSYASSASDPYGFFDVRAMAPSLDFFFVMAYDLEYSNWAHQPPGCVRFCLGPTAPLTNYYYNDTNSSAQYLGAVPASQVVLGVPYYGRKSCVSSPTPNQYPTTAVAADGYLDASQEYTAPEVKSGSYAAHRDANDPAGQERWDVWVNTTMNCIRELYWDDAVSLGQKYDLVNRDNLRGVGIWTLNYGGGAPALWSTLNTYFACPVSITLTSPATATQLIAGLSSGNCSAASFDVQEYDSTLNQGWFSLGSVPAANGSSSIALEGYQGHTYQVQVRAHATSGLVGSWAQATVDVSGTATKLHPWNGLYTLDGYGGIQTDDSAPLAVSAYWNNWRIARSAHVIGNGIAGGATLDGYGGLHSFGSPLTLKSTAYWQNWDIARDFAFLPNGTGGYVLDGYGGLHPFSVNAAAMPPAAQGFTYWHGWDIARKVVIAADGKSGYVLDAWGGVHSFGIGQAAPPEPVLSAYWHGWNIARGIVLLPGTLSGYVLDGYGGLHPFASPGVAMPPAAATSAYWHGWDIARAAWLEPSATSGAVTGYVLDGYGGLHPIGGAPAITRYTYWHGWDIAIGLAGG
jgi:spore germination protein YaaH